MVRLAGKITMQVSEFTTEQLYDALIRQAKSIMRDAGITVDDLQMNRIVNHTHVRNAKIRAEYEARITEGTKAEAVKMDLAGDFGLSFGAINKIVHGER